MKRNDRALAVLRIFVGALFLIFGEYKVAGPAFIHGGFRGWIERFISDGAYPFMLPILKGLILPHELFWGWAVAVGECAIGVSLILGLWVRAASFAGLLFMLALLFSSNYPGAGKPLWVYFGGSLDHSVLACCFLAFLLGDSCAVFSLSRARTVRSDRL
ncbi:MAG TPA: DoxX family protein [Myxococcales bacterium]|nr:DoxX family protein [Myxococcales bacterium]